MPLGRSGGSRRRRSLSSISAGSHANHDARPMPQGSLDSHIPELTTNEMTTHGSTTNEPTANEPAMNEPTTDEPTTSEPAMDETVGTTMESTSCLPQPIIPQTPTTSYARIDGADSPSPYLSDWEAETSHGRHQGLSCPCQKCSRKEIFWGEPLSMATASTPGPSRLTSNNAGTS